MIEQLEAELRLAIRISALPKSLGDPIAIIRSWLFFSGQVPRILGAILSRIQSPASQCLLAENISGECGDGTPSMMHSALLEQLAGSVIPGAAQASTSTASLDRRIEEVLQVIAAMDEARAIGFLVGLEAPAYDILDVLRRSLEAAGLESDAISMAPYMRIHEEIERTHQDNGRMMTEGAIRAGFAPDRIAEGARIAVRFWVDWWRSAEGSSGTVWLWRRP